MKKIFIIIILFINFLSACKAQKITAKQYVDMVISGNRIYALTNKGQIHILDVDNDSYIDSTNHSKKVISVIGLDKNGNVVVISSDKKISLINNKDIGSKTIGKAPAPVDNILFTRDNQSYLITTKGIFDTRNKRNYLPDTSFRLNKQVKGWTKPKAAFIDENDNIWLGYGFGEWGAELYIFSTQAKKFIKPSIDDKIDIEPIKSIFSDGKTIYISGSVQHMLTYGSIIKFNNFKCDSLFNSSDHKIPSTVDPGRLTWGGAEYIGPALFNKKDNSIYFYSQNGIFKGAIDKDLSNIKDWEKIAEPKLHWRNGQPDAVGSPINVLKMQFAENGKLFLVTQDDGIGIYDQKGFRLIN